MFTCDSLIRCWFLALLGDAVLGALDHGSHESIRAVKQLRPGDLNGHDAATPSQLGDSKRHLLHRQIKIVIAVEGSRDDCGTGGQRAQLRQFRGAILEARDKIESANAIADLESTLCL